MNFTMLNAFHASPATLRKLQGAYDADMMAALACANAHPVSDLEDIRCNEGIRAPYQADWDAKFSTRARQRTEHRRTRCTHADRGRIRLQTVIRRKRLGRERMRSLAE